MLFTLELTLEELRSVRAQGRGRARALAADDEARGAGATGTPAGIIEGHAEIRERGPGRSATSAKRAEAEGSAPGDRAARRPWTPGPPTRTDGPNTRKTLSCRLFGLYGLIVLYSQAGDEPGPFSRILPGPRRGEPERAHVCRRFH